MSETVMRNEFEPWPDLIRIISSNSLSLGLRAVGVQSGMSHHWSQGLSQEFCFPRKMHSCSCGALETLTYWWGCHHKIIRCCHCWVVNLFLLPFSHKADANPLGTNSQLRWNTRLTRMMLEIDLSRMLGCLEGICLYKIICAFWINTMEWHLHSFTSQSLTRRRIFSRES